MAKSSRAAATSIAMLGLLVAMLGLLAGCADLPMPDAVRSEQTHPTRQATTFFTAALPCVGRMVEESTNSTIIIVPDVLDGDAPQGMMSPGLGPRRLANDMLVVAAQNMRSRRVVAAIDLTAARRHASRLERSHSMPSTILFVTGGTLVEDDIRERNVGASASSGPVNASIGWNQSHRQFHLSMAVFTEDAVSIPGLGVEMNAVAETRNNQLRVGASTGNYEFSVGAGAAGTNVTRAQASQVLFQAGLMQIIGRASGVDISSCIARAHAVAEPYLYGLSAGADQRAAEGEIILIRLGFLAQRGSDQQSRAQAIAGFQTQLGLPVTGFIDEATFASMLMAAPR